MSLSWKTPTCGGQFRADCAHRPLSVSAVPPRTPLKSHADPPISPAFEIAELGNRLRAFPQNTQIRIAARTNGRAANRRLCAFLKRETNMAQGTVKFFNAQKGFGFIVQDNGGPDVFVHISAVERSGMHSLNEGQKLSFDVQADPRSGKSAAANLQAA